jgi:hypothetical protein
VIVEDFFLPLKKAPAKANTPKWQKNFLAFCQEVTINAPIHHFQIFSILKDFHGEDDGIAQCLEPAISQGIGDCYTITAHVRHMIKKKQEIYKEPPEALLNI